MCTKMVIPKDIKERGSKFRDNLKKFAAELAVFARKSKGELKAHTYADAKDYAHWVIMI